LHFQDKAEDIPDAESPIQHEINTNPDILTESCEGQANIVSIPDADSNSIRTIAPEPTNAFSSEHVTLQESVLN